MPAVLRRLCSAPSDGSRSPCDLETPPKRRRLTILDDCKAPADQRSEKAMLNQVFSSTSSTWTLEDFAKTPSRTEGISERDERIHRMMACDQARSIIRGILGQGDAVSPAIEMSRLRAQALACYHVQAFYMSASMKQVDSDLVALGASLAALKALNVLCFVDDLLKVFNEQQRAAGKPEMELTSEVELRITSLFASAQRSPFGDSRPDLALDFVEDTVDYLVGRLPESQAFSSCCQRRAPEKAAKLLAPQLKEAAQRLAVDAMLGPAAVLMRPVAVARVMVGMATRCMLKQLHAEVSADEIMSYMTEVTSPPGASENTGELRSATREVFGTYQLWGQEHRI
eukprot:TRINITY_DN12571_c0_g1_i1.p1 TRINITY_DN12571_c0_g1~~TRINITY_DN12571_c0_g1_i1.p1  ORF type:complete len:341 (+),score=86.73 TRINITY_DN12571_c0_g1_i1:82-1104(+)